MTQDWESVHWALDHHDWWLAARELSDGDDFVCTSEEADQLRPFLHSVGLDVVIDRTVGRGFVMTVAEAARVGPAGPVYGSQPLEELRVDRREFADAWGDDEPTLVEDQ